MYSKIVQGATAMNCFYIWLRKTKPIEARKNQVLFLLNKHIYHNDKMFIKTKNCLECVTTLKVYMNMYSKNCSWHNGHEICFYVWLRKTKPIDRRKIKILLNILIHFRYWNILVLKIYRPNTFTFFFGIGL